MFEYESDLKSSIKSSHSIVLKAWLKRNKYDKLNYSDKYLNDLIYGTIVKEFG